MIDFLYALGVITVLAALIGFVLAIADALLGLLLGMGKAVVLLFVFLFACLWFLGGCAYDKEQYEYELRVLRANWDNCAYVYHKAGIITSHRHIHTDKLNRGELLDDILLNDCKRVLGDEWLIP